MLRLCLGPPTAEYGFLPSIFSYADVPRKPEFQTTLCVTDSPQYLHVVVLCARTHTPKHTTNTYTKTHTLSTRTHTPAGGVPLPGFCQLLTQQDLSLYVNLKNEMVFHFMFNLVIKISMFNTFSDKYYHIQSIY